MFLFATFALTFSSNKYGSLDFSAIPNLISQLVNNKPVDISTVISPNTSSIASSQVSSSESVSSEVAVTHQDVDAYIADFAFKKGFDVFKKYSSSFKTITPVWFTLDPKQKDGLATKAATNDKTLIAYCKTNNIDLIPSISSFVYEDFSKILNDPTKLEAHTSAIVNYAVKNSYAGIDMDYENVEEGMKDQYEAFMTDLSGRLKKENKKLVITVLSKDFITENSTPTRRNQDWVFLSTLADTIRIMVYDYTTPIKKSYAVTPIFWMEDVARYAESKIPKEKISIGLPEYGYRYDQDGNKTPITYTDILAYRKKSGLVSDVLDSETGEKLLTYKENGKTYEAWYTDYEVDKKRRDLLMSIGIGKIFYWRLGDEDTRIFSDNK